LLSTSLALVLLSISLAPLFASAQSVDDADPWSGIEEMVVNGAGGSLIGQTEQMSVLSFDAEELLETRITNAQDLAAFTPNLEIKTGASNVASPTIFIRGIGLLDFNANASSSVAVLNDGMYMNSPLGQLFQFFDLAGVEVLRGPQGITNARNATAGAIRITPKRPDGGFSSTATMTYGNYNRIEAETALGFPIVPDVLSGRIAARYTKADGYTENRCARTPGTGTCDRAGNPSVPTSNEGRFGPVPNGLPRNVNDADNWAGRVQLRFQPNEDHDWILNVTGGQSMALAYQFQSRGISRPNNGIGVDSLGYADTDDDAFAGDYDLVGEQNLTLLNATLNGSVQLENAVFKSLTGYGLATSHSPPNFDAGPNQVAHAYNEVEVWQLTQELSLASDNDDRFSWEIGGFFLTELLDNSTDLLEGIVITSQRQEFEQRLQTWALFAKTGFELTEQITLEGGIRYNWERKEFDISVKGLLADSIPGAEDIQNVLEQDDEVWDEPTGEVKLIWSPTEAVSVYAKYTHGFKGGHFNGGALFSAQTIDGVEPEVIDAFEIGLKSEWLDGMITLNMAAWYYDYQDYQVFVVQNAGGSFPLGQLLNAPRLESKGVELDAVFRPLEGLELGLSMGILDATFTDFTISRLKFVLSCPTQPNCPPEQEVLKFSGNPLVAAPPVSVNVRISYEMLLGGLGTLTPRLDASFRDKTYFVPGNAAEISLGQDSFSKNEGASQDPYWLLNARIGYRTPDGHAEVAFWVQNLTDEVYLNNSLDASGGLNTYLDIHGQPRTFGVTGTFNW
jgi:iron complex outermembrane receptor protein